MLSLLLLGIFLLTACSDDEAQSVEKVVVKQLVNDNPDAEVQPKQSSSSHPPATEVQAEAGISDEDLIAAYVSAQLSGDSKKFIELAMQMSPELQKQAKVIVFEKIFNRKGVQKPEADESKIVSGTVIRDRSVQSFENVLVSLHPAGDLDIASGSLESLLELVRPDQQQALVFGSLHGMVVDIATKLPVGQVEVVLRPSKEVMAALLLAENLGELEKNLFKPAVSDEDGNFSFTSLPFGSYRVLAFKSAPAEPPHYVSAEAIVEILGGVNNTSTVEVMRVPEAEVQILAFSGYVYDQSNSEPVSGALLFDSDSTFSIHTDSLGYFSAEIAAGTLKLQVSHRHYQAYANEYTLPASGDKEIRIELLPITTGDIYVTVEDAVTGKPLGDVQVTMAGQGLVTDQEGRFQLLATEAGAIASNFNHPAYYPETKVVTVTAVAEEHVTIQLQPITIGKISGIVLDASDQSPLAGVLVRALTESVRTDLGGRFILEGIEAGLVAVYASKDVYLPADQDVPVSVMDTTDIKLSLVPVTWGSVSGRVLDSATNLAVANAGVNLTTQSTTSDDQGIFSLDKVAAGEITYTVKHPSYRSTTGARSLVAGESIAVTIMLELITWGTVAGKVVDAVTGDPIADAEVSFSGITLATDQMGRFLQDEVAAGELSVSASKAVYIPGIKAVTLAPTDSLDITIQLEPVTTGTVSGILIDGVSGKPVKGVRILIGGQAVETDQNGRFELEAVDAGNIQISSRHPDYKDATAQIKLSPTGTLEINLPLELRREDVAELETRLSEDGTIDLYGIHFDSAKDQFKLSSLPTLEALLVVIRRQPDKRFQLAGHTDSDGEEGYNQELSERRAAGVIKWLIDNGLNADQLISRGYGEGHPSAPNETEAGKALNRRVQLSLMP